MTAYLALLRGINLGNSRQPARMEDVRAVFTGLGYGDVRSYIQTGNIMFTSPDKPEKVAADVEAALADGIGLTARVILRTAEELADVPAANPFAAAEPDLAKLHVTFLAEEPDPAHAAGLTAPSGETARFSLVGKEVYLHCPDGYGRTKLSNNFLERRLGVPGTTRNWRVTTKLAELLRP